MEGMGTVPTCSVLGSFSVVLVEVEALAGTGECSGGNSEIGVI